MSFSQTVKEAAWVACGRTCCICHKNCGVNIELHHIKPKSKGGEDSFENAIPLCFDCHANAGHAYNSAHPKGNKFTGSELRRHRDQWYESIKKEQQESDFAIRITTGQELLAYIGTGTQAWQIKYDEPKSIDDMKLISGFLQEVGELVEIKDCLETADLVEIGFIYTQHIKELEEKNLWVFLKNGTGAQYGVKFKTIDIYITYSENSEVIVLNLQKKEDVGNET